MITWKDLLGTAFTRRQYEIAKSAALQWEQEAERFEEWTIEFHETGFVREYYGRSLIAIQHASHIRQLINANIAVHPNCGFEPLL